MALDNSIFKKVPAEFKYKLTINTEGLERTGKTNFIMTMPGPVAVLALDRNTENIAIKAQKAGKEILLADFCDANPKTNPLAKYVLPMRLAPGKTMKPEDKASKSFYEKRWEAIQQAYYDLVEDSSVKSIAIDSGSCLYDDCRLAILGKLQQIPPMKYGEVNSCLRDMLSAACNHNIVVTHKLGKLYEGNDWKGKYEAKGWGDMAYSMQITMRHSVAMIPHPDDPKQKKAQFTATIVDCNQDPSLIDAALTDEDITFPTLASLVFPDAPSALWE